jgi:cell division septal protein FtsQ
MWFRRKQRNRRLSREYVLDVQLRSSVVRAARSRRFALALGVSFAAVFGVYVLWRVGGWGLNQLLYENNAFAIRDVEVQTDGVISLDELRRWAGVKPGANLLALDLAEVKRNLEYVPFVASAAVERILPNTLRLRVTEREPVAQVNLPRPRSGGGVEVLVYQLDAEGFVMPPLDPRQRSTPLFQAEPPLPVMTGVNPNDLQSGRRVESPGVQAALRLITAFDRSPLMGLVELRRLDVGSPEVLVLTTGQGSTVTFGLQDFERQLLRWREIYDVGMRHQKAIASLDLAVTNNIPARWLEASALPAAPQKPANPPRTKRKHV